MKNGKKKNQGTAYLKISYHQMQLAYKLLAEKGCPVKDVARLMGYDNASKFTAKFKEQHGILPSEVGGRGL